MYHYHLTTSFWVTVNSTLLLSGTSVGKRIVIVAVLLKYLQFKAPPTLLLLYIRAWAILNAIELKQHSV